MPRAPATRRSNLDILSETPDLIKSPAIGVRTNRAGVTMCHQPDIAPPVTEDPRNPTVSEHPPPGWTPPAPPPGSGPAQPPPPGDPGGFQAGWGAPVHKPGVVPLRPLQLGDLFDGAFKTIRRNPTAMVGLAALVTALFMVVPVLVTLGLAAAGSLSAGAAGGGAGTPFIGQVGLGGSGATYGSTLLGSLFGGLASVVLNGMLVHVVSEAVLGRRSTIGATWRATRGRLLRLFGLAAASFLGLVVLVAVPVVAGVAVGTVSGIAGLLVGLPLGLLAILAGVYLSVRYLLLAPPALVLERTGVFASIKRAGQLSRHQFWRLLGLSLLAGLVAAIAGWVVAIPLAIVGALGPALLHGTAGSLLLVFSGFLSRIIVSALTTPFTSGVVALLYVDQRIRKEGLDVALIAASQQTAPPGP